jgi:hypothetical protein
MLTPEAAQQVDLKKVLHSLITPVEDAPNLQRCAAEFSGERQGLELVAGFWVGAHPTPS